MKLRSGKILLPPVIEKKLNHALVEFKTLLTNNEDFAKELIQLISSSTYFADTRCTIRHRIEEAFDYNNIEIRQDINNLSKTTGLLLRLITQNDSVFKDHHIQPVFHDIIQERMLEAFDIDVSLTGAVDQNHNIEM